MGYNHAKAERQFQLRWAAEEVMYQKAGMTEEQINGH